MTKFKIGDKVELNNETYEIVGTIKRSWVLEKDGKKYKATSNMMSRIKEDNETYGVRKKRKRAKRSSTYHMEKRLAFRRVLDKSTTFPLTENELLDHLDRVSCDLSPENLHCDGEISRSAAMAKAGSLRAEWREVENLLGRKVSEEEVETRMINKWNEWRNND